MGDAGRRVARGRFLGVILGLAGIVAVLFLSLWVVTSDLHWYSDFQRERNAYEYIRRTPEETDEAMHHLIRYIQFGGEDKLEPYFNAKEIAHMRDVRVLFLAAGGLAAMGLATVIAIIAYTVRRTRNAAVWRTARVTMLLATLVLAVGIGWMTLAFDRAFLAFHHIFFDNDLWLLNPNTDVMIRMLPQDLFLRLFVRIGVGFLIGVALLMGLFYILERKKGVQSARIH